MTSSFFIPGPAGRLELIIDEPSIAASIKLVGIVCHPHPLHEGTMNNKVVTTLARVFNRVGAISVRFNFRGVGMSEGTHGYGTGELDDLRAVIQWVNAKYPQHSLFLAGFSFGSFIAAKIAAEVLPAALITIAPPVHHNDFEHLPTFNFPWIVVQGDEDEIVPSSRVYAWLATLTKPPALIRMPKVGHFFHGKLIEMRDELIAFLQPIISKLIEKQH